MFSHLATSVTMMPLRTVGNTPVDSKASLMDYIKSIDPPVNTPPMTDFPSDKLLLKKS